MGKYDKKVKELKERAEQLNNNDGSFDYITMEDRNGTE